MKQFSLSTVLLTCLALFPFASRATAQTPSQAPLTNASVVKLVKAGFKEKTIITIIGSRVVRFDLSTDGLIELKRNRVSERVILAMLHQQEGLAFSDDDFADDSDFGNTNDLKRSLPGPNSGDRTGNTADIFGSSGGSQDQIKSRGSRGGSSGDTITSGSATVRILRPPAEAGAPPKLDKAQTLNNDSIVELVNGGFSEGTIIRRIEQSPVDFDLSPDKLNNLRKHGVSDKVLSAMKLAMGDSGETPTPATNGSSKQRN
ncbi:MAG TPA: hypothetical protein VLA93_14680 [Pyrinomonadaceae bacterium]|nr:hypothetical protein [Pyrinomonadaceae bacterium]